MLTEVAEVKGGSAKDHGRGITRREALRKLGKLAAGFVAGGLVGRGALRARGPAAERLNVVFIAVEDMRPMTGCYGVSRMVTPNIDALAARGVRFDHAYVQFSLCNPSRSTLLTGRRPDTTKVYNNKTSFRQALPEVVTLPEHFRRHGYWLGRTGKIYHGGLEEDGPWDEVAPAHVPAELRREKRVYSKGGNLADLEKKRKGLIGYCPVTWAALECPDEAMLDGQVALRAIELLRKRPADRPFFLAVGFHAPHLPYNAPKKYFDLYSLEDIELPPVPEGVERKLPGKLQWNDGLGDEECRQAILAYQACISLVDAQVGRLLEALDEDGLLDSTVIVFWGDHGTHLTEHGRWRKVTLYEVANRIPLIVAAPGRRQGARCGRLVETVDIYPTLAQLCGLDEPEGVEGISFAPLLDNPQRAWKKAAFSQIPRGKRVRDERFAYWELKWRGKLRTALFDVESDPVEWNNLAGKAEYADTVRRLGEVLRGGWKAALP